MIDRKCLVCGKNFKTYPCKVKVGKGKYCSKECSNKITLIKKGQVLSPTTLFKKGQKPWSFKGWRYAISRKNGRKYKQIFMPQHPFSSKAGYVREHRLAMEKHLNRFLKQTEIVHHLDGDTLNNSLSNLKLLDKREHDRQNTPLNIHKRWYMKEGGLYPHAK